MITSLIMIVYQWLTRCGFMQKQELPEVCEELHADIHSRDRKVIRRTPEPPFHNTNN
jgi:hypothetical protein